MCVKNINPLLGKSYLFWGMKLMLLKWYNRELGKKGGEKIPYRLTKRSDGSERKWDLFFDGKDNGKDFSW